MKALFGVHHGIIVALFFLHAGSSKAQSEIEVGSTVEFGGIIVSLNEQGQQRLQQEVNRLYADRGLIMSQLEQLRQLDPLLEETFRKVSLPVDFRFLVLPFDSKSTYWNIAPSLPEQLGLQTTPVAEDRLHPLLATEAVVAYLARLQQRNANALETAVQYIQAGDSLKTERLTGSGNVLALDPNSPALLWKLLARRLVFNREEPTFRPNRIFLLWTHEQSNGRTLQDIAFQYNLPTDRLQPFDSWLRGPNVPAEGAYPVLIRMLPEEYAAARGKLENAKQNPPGPELGFPVLRRMPPINSILNTPIILYEINSLPGIQAQPGDNAITLAFYGSISVRQFLEYNDMTNRHVVRPGEVYYLGPKLRRAKVPFHVLARGQSMWEVANIYGVRLKHLLRYNDLEPDQPVTAGRVIWLQRPRPRNQPIEYRELPPIPIPPVLAPIPDSTLNVPVVDSTQVLVQKLNKADSVLVDSTVTVSTPVAATVASTTTLATNRLPQAKRHTVRLGQTYYAISKWYGVTLNQLYAWNNLSERVPLRVGQELIVGNPGSGPKTTISRPAPAPPEQRFRMKFKIERDTVNKPVFRPNVNKTIVARYHIVRPGQTVYRVALINKVSIEQVMRLNNLRSYTIEVGQRLRVR